MKHKILLSLLFLFSLSLGLANTLYAGSIIVFPINHVNTTIDFYCKNTIDKDEFNILHLNCNKQINLTYARFVCDGGSNITIYTHPASNNSCLIFITYYQPITQKEVLKVVSTTTVREPIVNTTYKTLVFEKTYNLSNEQLNKLLDKKLTRLEEKLTTKLEEQRRETTQLIDFLTKRVEEQTTNIASTLAIILFLSFILLVPLTLYLHHKLKHLL